MAQFHFHYAPCPPLLDAVQAETYHPYLANNFQDHQGCATEGAGHSSVGGQF